MSDEPWVHYAREALLEFPPEVSPDAGCNSIKPASWCLHFARGTAWRDWAQVNLTPRGYTHKYELVNGDQLNIFTIDMAFVKIHQLQPDCTLDWRVFVNTGCDGVLVCRNEIMAALAYPEPWFIFASARENDELVIWRNAQLVERRLDWAKEYFLRSCAREAELASKWKADHSNEFADMLQLRARMREEE